MLAALAARAGLALEVTRIGLTQLRATPLPAIARGEDGEFFLIVGLRDDGVQIIEPAHDAPHVLSLEQFTQRWTGVALIDPQAPGAGSSSPSGDSSRAASRRAWPAAIAGLVVLVMLGAASWWAATRTVEIVAWGTARIPQLAEAIEIGAPQAGSIRRVLVGNGDAVAPGDVLLELLVRTSVPEELDREAVLDAELDVARADAMLAAISLDAPPRLRALPNVDSSRRLLEERSLASRYESYRANLNGLDAAIEKAGAQRRAAEESIATLREGLASALKRAAESKSLLDQGFISRNAYLEREERVAQLQRDLDKQTESARVAAAAFEEATATRRTLTAETRKEFEADRRDALQRLGVLRTAAVRPKQSEQIVEVRAGQRGQVRLQPGTQLGATVSADQALANVQPAMQIDEIVATLEPGRAAHVRTGMPATVLRAGVAPPPTPLNAAVVALSQDDAISGQNADGARMRATLRLERSVPIQSAAEVRSGEAVLVPGAEVMVRIPVGTRSLLASWFDP